MEPDADSGLRPPDIHDEAQMLNELNSAESTPSANYGSKMYLACADIVVHAWRANKRMTDRTTGEIKEDLRMIHRSVAAILSVLGEIGFQLRDREGEAYDYGLPEKVVAAEKRSGISREIVAETIRPSVFCNGRLLRAGEIIIAVPDSDPTPAETSGEQHGEKTAA